MHGQVVLEQSLIIGYSIEVLFPQECNRSCRSQLRGATNFDLAPSQSCARFAFVVPTLEILQSPRSFVSIFLVEMAAGTAANGKGGQVKILQRLGVGDRDRKGPAASSSCSCAAVTLVRGCNRRSRLGRSRGTKKARSTMQSLFVR